MTSSEHRRTIIHFDIDCFYAQVEMIRNPALRDKPLGIRQKYILVTCNYEARKRGITKLMSLADAQKKCPSLIIVNGEDLTHYRNMSYQISDFIQKYTPAVERLGFDENFVDVSEMVEDRIKNGNFKSNFLGNIYEFDNELINSADECAVCDCGCLRRIQVGSEIALDIREGLKHELGITCCAGIAHNKLLAKLVGSIHKPNQQTSILPHLGCQLVSSLPGLRSIPGVGSSSEKRLKARGISSIWDLQQARSSVLEEEFGKAMAETLSKLCFGIDESPVVPFTLPQTLSDEDSFKCCNELDDVKHRIHLLLLSLLKRLKEDTRIPSTLRLTVRRNNYTRYSRQCPVAQSIFKGFFKEDGLELTVSQLMPVLINLFHKLVDVSQAFHLTLINVCFAKLVEPNSKQNTLDSFFKAGHLHNSSSKVPVNESQSFVKKITSTGCLESCKEDESKSQQISKNECENLSSNIRLALTDDRQEEDSNTMLNNGSQKQNAHQTKITSQENEQHKKMTDSSIPPLSPSAPVLAENSRTDRAKDEIVLYSQPIRNSKPNQGVNTESSNTPCWSNRSLSTLKRLLPKHIDACEVLQLPEDIQKEILSSFGILIEISNDGEQIVTQLNKVLTRKQTQLESKNTTHQQNENLNSGLDLSRRKSLFKSRKRKMDNEAIMSCISKPNTSKIIVLEKNDALSCATINDCNDDISTRQTIMERQTAEQAEISDTLSVDFNSSSSSLSSLLYSSTIDSSIAVPRAEELLHPSSPGCENVVIQDKILVSDAKNLISNSCTEKTIIEQLKLSDHTTILTNTCNEIVIPLPYASEDVQISNSIFLQHSKKDSHVCKEEINQNLKEQISIDRDNLFIDVSNNRLVSRSEKKCPEGMDPGVFFTLPLNIQGEILAHNAMGTGNLFLNDNSSDQKPSSSGTSRRHSLASKTKPNNSTSSKVIKKNLFDYFKKS